MVSTRRIEPGALPHARNVLSNVDFIPMSGCDWGRVRCAAGFATIMTRSDNLTMIVHIVGGRLDP